MLKLNSSSKKSLMRNIRGSLSLEQVLFIGAIVVMATGIGAFYADLGNYFASIKGSTLMNSPQN